MILHRCLASLDATAVIFPENPQPQAGTPVDLSWAHAFRSQGANEALCSRRPPVIDAAQARVARLAAARSADTRRNGRRLELPGRLPGKSRSDFISKLTTAEEEADETSYWLELLVGCQAFPIERIRPMLQEASELTAIFVSSIKTAKKNRS